MSASEDQFDWLKDDKYESKFKKNSEKMTQMLQKRVKDGKPPLHSYQVEAVLKTGKMIKEDITAKMDTDDHGVIKPVIIWAPTGAGKSGMIVLLPYVLSSDKVLVLTPSKVISEQLAIDFGYRKDRKCFFENIGMVKNDKDGKDILKLLLEDVKVINSPSDIQEERGNVVIVNAQKFGGRSKLTLSLVYRNEDIIEDVQAFFQEFDTLIVDEAHHYPAETWVNIVEQFCKPVAGMYKKIIFLTATPYKRIDGKEQFILGKRRECKERISYRITQQMVQGVSTRECKFKEPQHDPSYENVLRDVLKIFSENKKKEPRFESKAMILVWTKKEATALVDFLNMETGNDQFAISVIATTPNSLGDFTKKAYRVAVTCGVGKEGYDNTDVTLCVILRKITSKILFTQFVGRCLRLRRGLPGNSPDQSVGTVLSYPKFDQRKNWEEREELAVDHPEEVD